MAAGSGEEGGARALALIVAAVFSAGVAAGLSRLALARYVRVDLGASVLLASSLTSWFMAPRAFSALAAGLLSDFTPWARRLLMSAPMLAISLIVYVIGGLRDPFLVVLLNAAWGALSGMVWPVTQAVTALLARSRPGSVMSLYFASAFLGMVIGQGLYGVLPLTNPGMVRASSAFFAASGLLLAAASRRAPPPPPRRAARREIGAAARSLTAATLWLLAASLVMGYVGGMLREFLYVYLGDVYGLTRRDLAGVLAASGLLAFTASLATGPLADRLGPGPVLSGLLASASLGLIAVAAAPGGLAGVALGIALANTATRSSLPLTRNAAFLGTGLASTLVALSNTLNNAGQVVSPLVSAALYQAASGTRIGPLPGHAAPFLVAAALTASVLAAYPAVAKKRQGREGAGA